MRRAPALLPLLAVLLLPACRPSPPRLPPATPLPVVHVSPIQTQPYEEGFNAGYEAGREEARPRAKMPAEDAAGVRALEAAGLDPARNQKWQHGWRTGYLDAWHEVSENRK